EMAEQDPAVGSSGFLFDFAPVSGGEWGKTPALVFGEDYEVAIFGITNSGALPKVLSETHPCVLVQQPPGQNEIPSSKTRTVKYLRTTSVGIPRFASLEAGRSGSTMQQLDDKPLTPFPQEVVPLAHDLGIDKNPLILLWRNRDKYSFSVSAPATDINSW